jgi:hypothetical protein
MSKDKLAILKADFDANWAEFDASMEENLAAFRAELKKAAAAIKAWALIRKPTFERWAREGGEGLTAFVIAVLQGETGREKAMAKNTGSDASSVIGFNLGLVERDVFWATVNGFLAAGKLPGWILPIIAEILRQVKPEVSK